MAPRSAAALVTAVSLLAQVLTVDSMGVLTVGNPLPWSTALPHLKVSSRGEKRLDRERGLMPFAAAPAAAITFPLTPSHCHCHCHRRRVQSNNATAAGAAGATPLHPHSTFVSTACFSSSTATTR